MKKCPYCAEDIQDEALICKHCNREIQQRSQSQVNKNSDTKKILKIAGIVALVLLSIPFWYLTIPVAILFYLWRTKRFNKKNKGIAAVATVVVFVILGSVNAYAGRQPTITIAEPEDSTSVQTDAITVKGGIDPKSSTVTVQGNKVTVNDKGEFSYEAKLRDESNSIAVEAKNGRRSAKKTISVTRIFTEDEKAERERLAQENAEQRANQQEEEAKRKEEEEKQKAKADAEDDGNVAAICAQNYVEDNLKSPSSADFPWSLGNKTALGDNKYLVSSYVDAQNSFGAEIRTNYICNVEVINAGNYQCRTTCEFDS